VSKRRSSEHVDYWQRAVGAVDQRLECKTLEQSNLVSNVSHWGDVSQVQGSNRPNTHRVWHQDAIGQQVAAIPCLDYEFHLALIFTFYVLKPSCNQH
jgi:hypothetical protein